MKRKNLELSCIMLGKALKKLREACDKAEKQDKEMEIYRDATIQRFEFTVELFWKSLKKENSGIRKDRCEYTKSSAKRKLSGGINRR